MPSPLSWTEQDGVAVVAMDAPESKVNILDADFLGALQATAEELARAPGLQAVIVHSRKPAGFIAGADIQTIESVTDPAEGARLARQGQRIFQAWADLGIPVVAALHGHCLGGGCEFALACSHRIGAPSLAMALPEIKLGILPGFGGTQRLPRLLGLEKSLDMILTGRTVKAGQAKAMGLIDRLGDDDQLLDQAVAMAREIVAAPARFPAPGATRTTGLRHWLLEKTPFGRSLLFEQAAKTVQHRTGGHYPAPKAALAVIRQTCRMPLAEGLEVEAKALGELVVTPESKNLVHLFHLSQRPKKGPGLAAEPHRVSRAAVLGAGVMGASIAWVLAKHGIQVALKDIDPNAVERGLAHARTLFSKQLAAKGGEQAVDQAMALLHGTTDYTDFDKIDLVIEAILERMDVKQSVLAEVEKHLCADAVFATNTSALSVTTLQQVAARPRQVAGMHFFNPVEKMPLVEVIRGDQTDEAAVATVYELARRLDKIPIVVADRTGFLVNRLLVTYLNEACLMVEEGVAWQSLETLATEFGMPMGPFRLVDEVGVDIAREVGHTLTAAFAYLPASRLLDDIHAAGLLGKKGGKGFYLYGAKHPSVNPELQRLLPTDSRPATAADWQRLVMVMVAEATRCLAEGVVSEAADIDAGMVFGTGFPPFRGGLCRWADAEFGADLDARLRALADVHGERYLPAGGVTPFYP